jgi:hypothetical protein
MICIEVPEIFVMDGSLGVLLVHSDPSYLEDSYNQKVGWDNWKEK